MEEQAVHNGIAKLLAAVFRIEPAPTPDLGEALDRAHLSANRWEACVEQIEACRNLTRRQLGLLADGSEGIEHLDAKSAEQRLAHGLRRFLRHLACLVTSPGVKTIEQLAAEVHAIVYGPEAAFSEVTWRDYVAVLQGRDGQPSVWQLREAAALVRSGVGQAAIREATGLGERPLKQLSMFLGVEAWRAESRQRAARVAVVKNWSPDELAERYNAEADGLDQMRPRTARAHIAEAKAAQAEEAVPA